MGLNYHFVIKPMGLISSKYVKKKKEPDNKAIVLCRHILTFIRVITPLRFFFLNHHNLEF
jgi:hypothetical protein